MVLGGFVGGDNEEAELGGDEDEFAIVGNWAAEYELWLDGLKSLYVIKCILACHFVYCDVTFRLYLHLLLEYCIDEIIIWVYWDNKSQTYCRLNLTNYTLKV